MVFKQLNSIPGQNSRTFKGIQKSPVSSKVKSQYLAYNKKSAACKEARKHDSR